MLVTPRISHSPPLGSAAKLPSNTAILSTLFSGGPATTFVLVTLQIPVSPPTKVATRFIQEFLVLAAIAISKSSLAKCSAVPAHQPLGSNRNRFPKFLFVSCEVWSGLVRPPGFEVPSRCLDGFPGRWVGSPLDATRGYVLDQARLRPLTMRQSRCLFLPYDWQGILNKRRCVI